MDDCQSEGGEAGIVQPAPRSAANPPSHVKAGDEQNGKPDVDLAAGDEQRLVTRGEWHDDGSQRKPYVSIAH